ncbi:hypothetical protein SEA_SCOOBYDOOBYDOO_11 [Mycobacterium phage ScoobyDoobyDoo]|nr:hypothetical protein SEA_SCOOBYDOOBYDOO_11 [Mycobacterium phage ScoobyDoobyDoo]
MPDPLSDARWALAQSQRELADALDVQEALRREHEHAKGRTQRAAARVKACQDKLRVLSR